MKKILIITYYWPPAGGPGVQRWLKFTKYLPDLGYEPHVYCPENPSYPILDESLLTEINPAVKVIRQKIWEPYQLAEKLNPKNKAYKSGHFEKKESQSLLSRLSVFIRGNFFIPDARVAWVKPSVVFLKDYIEQEGIDTIVTSGPPHSLHLIGLNLKGQLPDLKWIADFRDPWTQISYHSQLKLTKWAVERHQNLERYVMQNANLVLATSYADGKNFKALGAKNVEVITNGFDPIPRIAQEKSNHFKMTYSGGLEMLRNPLAIWKALENIIQENPQFAKDLQLHFYGSLAEDVQQTIIDHQLGESLIAHGYVSHGESLQAIQSANILLLTNFDNNASRGIIPGKIFEYMATSNPILAVGPADADVEKILNDTSAGAYFNHQDITAIQSYIKLLYTHWLNSIPNNSQINQEAVNRFTRENLTKQLSAAIEKVS